MDAGEAANGGSGGFIVSHSGPIMGHPCQQNAAAAFFARSRPKHVPAAGSPVRQAQLTGTASNGARREGEEQEEGEEGAEEERIFDFSAILRKCPPPVPSFLLKAMDPAASDSSANASAVSNGFSSSLSYGPTHGKVRVILRVANSGIIDEKRGSFFKMDQKKRQGRQHPDERKKWICAEKISLPCEI